MLFSSFGVAIACFHACSAIISCICDFGKSVHLVIGCHIVRFRVTGFGYMGVSCSCSKETNISRVSSGSLKPESSGTGVGLVLGSLALTINSRMFLAFLNAMRGGFGKIFLSVSLLWIECQCLFTAWRTSL